MNHDGDTSGDETVAGINPMHERSQRPNKGRANEAPHLETVAVPASAVGRSGRRADDDSSRSSGGSRSTGHDDRSAAGQSISATAHGATAASRRRRPDKVGRKINLDATTTMEGKVSVTRVSDGVLPADGQLKLNTSIRALQMVARLRIRVRRGHEDVSKRLGATLVICSIAHNVTLAITGNIGGGWLCMRTTRTLSVSSFIMHVGLALSHPGMRRLLWAHYVLLVSDAVIEGVLYFLRGALAWAVYHIVGKGCILYPIGAWAIHRFMNVVQTFELATRDAVAHAAIIVIAGSMTPIAYFSLNGLLCVGFSRDPGPGQNCGVRVAVNYTSALAVCANAVLFVLLTIRPLSLRQMTHLDIPTSQLVAFAFYGMVLTLALTLHSQNETFAPSSATIELLSTLAGPFLLLFFSAFAMDIVQYKAARDAKLDTQAAVEEDASSTPDPRERTAAVAASGTHYGAMIPHRLVMVSFTAIYLVVEMCPVGDVVRIPFAPLSMGSACFHLWLTFEESDVGRPALTHFLAHSSSAGIIGVRAMCNDDWPQALSALFSLVIMYPGLLKSLTRFRASVWSHGSDSAAKCAAVTFITFFGAVVPAMLYLGADSLGCAQRHMHEQGTREKLCPNRVIANQVGAMHVFYSVGAGIVLTNSEGGAGFDTLAAVQLELSWPEGVAGSLMAVATVIALFLFATRESRQDLTNSNFVLANLFIACWVVAVLTLTLNTKKANKSRQKRRERASSKREQRKASTMPGQKRICSVGQPVVAMLPRAWSFVLVALSFASYTGASALNNAISCMFVLHVCFTCLLLLTFTRMFSLHIRAAPQTVRWAFQVEWLRGAIGAFSHLCFVCHFFLLTNETSEKGILTSHLIMHLAGHASSFAATSRVAGVTAGLVVAYLIGTSGVLCEFFLFVRVVKPILALRNKRLHDELPLTIFRWMFHKAGLVMALYCYFEAVGVGFDSSLSSKDVSPWLTANNTTILHLTFSVALGSTLIADASTSLSAVLRGKAPSYVTVGFALSMCTSLIPLAMFAGREFAGRRQSAMYSTASVSFILLWAINLGVVSAGHSSQDALRAGDEDPQRSLLVRLGTRMRNLSGATSGGAAISAGI